MKVQGCDCSITIKTEYREFDVPYSEETIREAYSLLQEEAAIEGDGTCRAIRKSNGITGCIVTPLTIETAPLLLYIAMGSAELPVFVSETRNLYKYQIDLIPMEDTECFELIQDRSGNRELGIGNGERRLFEGCRVKGFELRVVRGEAVKLKLDVASNIPPVTYPYYDVIENETGERFNGDNVKYKINGKDYKNIYGITLLSKKEGGTITEIWIKRVLEQGNEISGIIEELVITAQLLRDKYEYRHYGIFRITINRLVLTADETNVNCTDTVIAPLRYYVTGRVSTEVFTNGGEGVK